MWIRIREIKTMKKKIAALEKVYQEQQEILNAIVKTRDEELEQMKESFAEIKENMQKGIIEAIIQINQSKHEQTNHLNP